ncbi:protein halfway isoform X1 [Diabrotica undecimpunctata]|uniref:protein halfway isoform X1 n=2 Tax=Diabrotica undecimpunctata TaxID=50387 RepID=UPI003B63D55D
MMILGTLLTIFLCFLPTWSRLPEELREDDSKCYQQCFHKSENECPSPSDSCRCRQLSDCKKAVVCCDINDQSLKDQLRCGNLIQNEIEALHIRNATLEVLNLNLAEWKNLRSMAITDGRIKNVSEAFPKMTMVSCLNLSSNGIREFQKRSLFNLFSLSFLDLSHNNLTEVPNFKMDGAVTLDILGNPSIQCTSVRETFNKSKISFKNENSTYCSIATKTFGWFDAKDQVAVSELRRAHELENNCIKNCTCKPHSLTLGMGQPRVYTVSVECPSSNLHYLPKPLPPYTVALDVSNNSISSLKELNDPSYQQLRILKADNNEITSIEPLEGTLFKSNFEVLSLRNNKIKNIDPYLLEFYRSSISMRKVYLGLNELTCDCTTITDFKMWLQTKSDFIKDYREIKCEGTDISVINMDPSKYCRSHEDWTDYIYWIIAAEVFLLISLITKVSYDYWVFKTAGYLPWPASKMPKLPCDWLCE